MHWLKGGVRDAGAAGSEGDKGKERTSIHLQSAKTVDRRSDICTSDSVSLDLLCFVPGSDLSIDSFPIPIMRTQAKAFYLIHPDCILSAGCHLLPAHI